MLLDQMKKTYPSDIKIAKLQKAIDVQDSIRLCEKLIESNREYIQRTPWMKINYTSKINKLKKRIKLLEYGYELIIREL